VAGETEALQCVSVRGTVNSSVGKPVYQSTATPDSHSCSMSMLMMNAANALVKAVMAEATTDENHRAPSLVCSTGGVPEWSIGTALKTVVASGLPWARIPPPPLPKSQRLREPIVRSPDSCKSSHL
jgi:hypothetical protein